VSFAEGEAYNLILDQTPFYAESGGQVSDKGNVSSAFCKLNVGSLKKVEGIFLHKVNGTGTVKIGDLLSLNVDPETRKLTRLHHTSCHLLQAALRKVLGNQVQQMGSQVGPEYTRFDFNFERALTKEEIKEVEAIVNSWIDKKLPAITKVMNFDDAVKAGALSFFEEKYDDEVRVLFVGNDSEMASIELCGGTHVNNIAEIEKIIIVSESSVASGIRRIKLLASNVADQYIKEKQEQEKAQAALEAEQARLKEEAKARKAEMTKIVLAKQDEFASMVENASGVKTLVLDINKYFTEGVDAEVLKTLAETLIAKLGDKAFVFIADHCDGKVIFIAASSSEINASNAVKQAAQICGGGGGGRPNFAQAGGKDANKIAEAIKVVNASLRAERSEAKQSH
jgi:alanyl-tRNA synthetase